LHRSDQVKWRRMGSRAGTEKGKQSFSDSAVGSACAAAVGIIVGILPPGGITPASTHPSTLGVLERASGFINQPVCLLVFVAVLTISTIYKRPLGIVNLVTFFLIAGIVTHLIRHWVFR
jgi:hypothetical protein